MPTYKALLALHHPLNGRAVHIVTDVLCAAGCISWCLYAGLCAGVTGSVS
jgi:hypothetical protein